MCVCVCEREMKKDWRGGRKTKEIKDHLELRKHSKSRCYLLSVSLANYAPLHNTYKG